MEGADITCEVEYGTSTLDISKNKLETERKELIEEIERKEKEKVHLVETMASAEEAYVAIEEAKLKIESLKEILQLKKMRFVVKNCSDVGGKIEKILENVQKSKYKMVIYLAKNIR